MARPRNNRSTRRHGPDPGAKATESAQDVASIKPDDSVVKISEPLWQRLNGRESLILSIAIVVVCTLMVFRQVTLFDFVYYDDSIHVYANPHFQHFSVRDIAYFWSHPYQGLYVPLSYALFGLLVVIAHRPGSYQQFTTTGAMLDPHVFHVANLLLHLVNVVLVLLLLRRLTHKDLASLFGALIFAVHPFQVESVAWISELRGLLGAVFCLVSLHLYLSYIALKDQGKSLSYSAAYAASLLCGFCSILAKPSSCILFLIVPAIGYWGCGRSWKASTFNGIPFLPAGIVTVILTALVQSAPPHQVAAVWQRPFIAGDTLTFYMWKLVLPFGLAIDYGRQPMWVMSHWWAYIMWLPPAVVAFVSIKLRERAPWILFGVAIAFASLLPVLGLTPFVFQAISTTADRYMYIAMIGVALSVSFGFAAVSPRRTWQVGAVIATWVVVLGLLSYKQTSYWSGSRLLFEHAVAVNPNSAVADQGLGQLLDQNNQFAQAEFYDSRAATASPSNPNIRHDLATAYAGLGDNRDAETQFRMSIALNPEDAASYRDLGSLLIKDNRTAEAVRVLQQAIRIDPTDSQAIDVLGDYYLTSHNYNLAIETFGDGTRTCPNSPSVWRNLGEALFAAGHVQDALGPIQAALQLSPADPLANAMLARILHSQQ
jgi:protein O-mannosyl-transferase